MPDNQNNKVNFPTLMKRARWDRLLAALAVVLIPIILISLLAKSCGKKKEPESVAETTPIIETAETVLPETTRTPDKSKTIFLAPSTQEDHVYACDGKTTEEDAMFDLAGRVKELLEAEGYLVYVCDKNDNVKKKVTKGNDYGCAAYVALYSNANLEDAGGTGTACYYNSEIPGSQVLAENVYNRVAEVTPTDDRGLKDETMRDLYEIMNNHYPCCLLEVEFHDSAESSQWILDNMDSTAKAINDGIVAFLTNQTARTTPDEPIEEPIATEAVEYDYNYGMEEGA